MKYKKSYCYQSVNQVNFKLHLFIKFLVILAATLLISKFSYANNVSSATTATSSDTISINSNHFSYRNYTESALSVKVANIADENASTANYIGNSNKHISPEKEKLSEYAGVPGTAPSGQTISAAGTAVEQVPAGADMFVFFTQTLANGFYYEGRLYGKYNMVTQDPVFPSIPASSENNPLGYKGVVKLGYNFHH